MTPGWWQQPCPGRTHFLQGSRRGSLPGHWGHHPLHRQQESQPVAPGPLVSCRMAAWWLLFCTASALPRPLLVLGTPGPRPQGKAVQWLGRLGEPSSYSIWRPLLSGPFPPLGNADQHPGHSLGSRWNQGCVKTENAQPGAAVAGTAVLTRNALSYHVDSCTILFQNEPRGA